MQRYPNGTRTDHSALARPEYGLLALEDPAGDPDAAGPQGIEDSPEDTTGIGGTEGNETGTKEQNGQHTLLLRGYPEDEEAEQGPPEQQHMINVCSHQEDGGGGSPLHSSTRFLCTATG